jgi:4-hydroxybenzoate polyprenyltransferase
VKGTVADVLLGALIGFALFLGWHALSPLWRGSLAVLSSVTLVMPILGGIIALWIVGRLVVRAR